MFRKFFSLALVLIAGSAISAGVVNFDDLSLGSESYWNGSDYSAGFASGGALFNNSFADYGGGYVAWEGWAYSNVTNNTTQGYTNQYSAITGSALSGSNYGVAYVGYAGLPTITLEVASTVGGMYITNTTYAYYTMLNGDAYSRQFNSSDWFLLTVTGFDAVGGATGTVNFYLAQNGTILNDWAYVDLSSLGVVSSLTFVLSSTDNGMFGMNTPAYFAMDNFVIPEPATMFVLALGGLLLGRNKS